MKKIFIFLPFVCFSASLLAMPPKQLPGMINIQKAQQVERQEPDRSRQVDTLAIHAAMEKINNRKEDLPLGTIQVLAPLGLTQEQARNALEDLLRKEREAQR